MDAEAERGVPVDLAVDDDLVRTVKLRRVRLAAGYDIRIQSSASMSAPRQCMSCLTSRAMVTGA